jgi:pimeloyl-ACP methyl ester carboxylesterase
MRRVFRFVVALIALAVAGALGYGAWRNPESGPLDAAARATAPGKFVTLPGGVTHYELVSAVAGTRADTNRVVVLVHGFSVPFYIWDSTVVALTRAGRRVLRYDLYGRGWSDRPDAAYDGPMYDAQLAALLDSLRITQPVDLVGLSFGGFVTAHFAGTHRARVRTLTLVDPVSTTRTLPGVLTNGLVGPWFFQTVAVPDMAEGQPSDFLHPERFPDWVERYRPQMKYDGFGRALRRSLITMSKTNFFALFDRVSANRVPTLLIWGKQDRTVPIANADSVRYAIPGLTLVAVDSSGHLPHMEQSATTHAAMLAFFSRHP